MNTLAPVVTNLDNQYRPARPLDVFELAERMRAYGNPDLDKLVTRAWDARSAIDQTAADLDNGGQPVALLDLDPTEIPALLRSAAHDQATRLLDPAGYSPAVRASMHLSDQLTAELKAALPAFADHVVKAMRPAFTKHAAVIASAAKHDITNATDPTDLVVYGTPDQIETFRALPSAVAGLEQIAGLRDALTTTLNYGPADLLGLAYVKTGDLQTAVNRYEVETETAQYHPETNGSTFVKVRIDRLGGRWLRMVEGGVTLRLNTAAEVEALRAEAKAA